MSPLDIRDLDALERKYPEVGLRLAVDKNESEEYDSVGIGAEVLGREGFRGAPRAR